MSTFTFHLLTQETLYGYCHEVRNAAIRDLAKNWSQEPSVVTLLKNLTLNASDGHVWKTALHELVDGWGNDPDIVAFLKEHALIFNTWDNFHWYVIAELIKNNRSNSDLWDILKKSILESSDFNYRCRLIAIRAIARHRKYDSETLTFLKKIATINRRFEEYFGDYEIRIAAIQEIERGWSGDADIFVFLKQVLSKETDGLVRAKIIHTLARGWKDVVDTVEILKKRAVEDEDGIVRSAAIDELRYGFEYYNNGLFDIIVNRVQNDSDPIVRVAAIKSFGEKFWGNNQQILTLLKYQAAKNKNGEVRDIAVRILSKSTINDADLLCILKEKAQKDRSSGVRETALILLPLKAREDPETLVILKHKAQNDRQENVRNAAVKELLSGWRCEFEVYDILKSLAQNSSLYGTQVLAMELMISYRKQDNQLLAILKSVALDQDSNTGARVLSIKELAKTWGKNPETFLVFKKIADWECEYITHDLYNDVDVDVSVAAIEGLARNWKENPEVFAILMRMVNDGYESRVFETAFFELLDGWSDNADVQLMIMRYVEGNEDTIELKANFKRRLECVNNNSDDQSFIYDNFNNTQKGDYTLRVKALQKLISVWKIDCDMLVWLKKNAENYSDKVWQLTILRELDAQWSADKNITLFNNNVIKKMKSLPTGFNIPTHKQSSLSDSVNMDVKQVELPEILSVQTQCIDIDNNTYKTVKIAFQIWMAENLKVSHYRNGDPIYYAKSNLEWQSASENRVGAWCFLDNNPSNGNVLGKLYNWYAVNDPRGISPIEWHVASDEDWKELELYLGMSKEDVDDAHDLRGETQNVASFLIASGFNIENDAFNVLPTALRHDNGDFEYHEWCYTWTSSQEDLEIAWERTFFDKRKGISRLSIHKGYGFSIRCIKNKA